MPSNGANVESGRFGSASRRFRPRIVSEDDGRSACWQQRIEQRRLLRLQRMAFAPSEEGAPLRVT